MTGPEVILTALLIVACAGWWRAHKKVKQLEHVLTTDTIMAELVKIIQDAKRSNTPEH